MDNYTDKMNAERQQTAYIPNARLGSYQSGANDAPTEQSPFTAAGITFAAAQDLARRVGMLADRLCGTIPTPVQGGKPTSDTPFVLPALRQMANDTAALIDEAQDAMARIERSLP